MTTTATAIDLKELVTGIARQARAASLELTSLDTATKNAVLETLAEKLEAATESILQANARDLAAGEANDLAKPLLERLTLNPERIAKMAKGVWEVIALPDPVGEEIEKIERPNGLDIRKVRVPMGVVGIIYESRPNVTIDCAVLCFKSGNAAILRGGKEALHSNQALAAVIGEALEAHGVNRAAVQLIPVIDRGALEHLIRLNEYIHCIIPRGGEGLIRYVVENGTIPVIKHYAGVCNVYVDAQADATLAESLVVNTKCQRPSVCNATENFIIHRDVAEAMLPRLGQALSERGVDLRADERATAILKDAGIASTPATEDDYYAEFLDLILAVKVVDSLEAGIQFINTYGSAHSDLIVTSDEASARKFMQGVDSATVYWNASTRFTDGFEFGLGAEIGISTDRLHARGPMGLRELCTYKFLIFGQGQIRE
ncbi:MAG: glutamate-5-semialdehyde dehydrogenase [Opitutales bacterium]